MNTAHELLNAWFDAARPLICSQCAALSSRRCWAAWIYANRDYLQSEPLQVLCKELLLLCHPDKHSRYPFESVKALVDDMKSVNQWQSFALSLYMEHRDGRCVEASATMEEALMAACCQSMNIAVHQVGESIVNAYVRYENERLGLQNQLREERRLHAMSESDWHQELSKKDSEIARCHFQLSETNNSQPMIDIEMNYNKVLLAFDQLCKDHQIHLLRHFIMEKDLCEQETLRSILQHQIETLEGELILVRHQLQQCVSMNMCFQQTMVEERDRFQREWNEINQQRLAESPYDNKVIVDSMIELCMMRPVAKRSRMSRK